MTESYSIEELNEWARLTPEQRILESEKLWEEFLVKYPDYLKNRSPFWKSFDSFESYREWVKEQGDPTLW